MLKDRGMPLSNSFKYKTTMAVGTRTDTRPVYTRDTYTSESSGGMVAVSIILAALIIGFIIYLMQASGARNASVNPFTNAIQSAGENVREGANQLQQSTPSVNPDTNQGSNQTQTQQTPGVQGQGQFQATTP
jgi:hypothetical protein